MTFGGGFRNPPVGIQGAISRPQFKSPNYVPGTTGWAIFKNGNVEFNSGTFRGTVTAGTFQGTDFIINSSGAFFYSGTPALGNLIFSITAAAGTDGFGNAYQLGVTSYDNTLHLFVNLSTGVMISNSIGASSALASLFTPGAQGITELTTGLSSLSDTAASVSLLSSQQANDANGPEIYAATRIVAAASIFAANPSSTKVQETWHDTAGLTNGWGKGSGFFKYTMLPDGNVMISAQGLTIGTVADGTTILTSANGLPSAYRPATAKPIVADTNALKVSPVSSSTFENARLVFNTDGSVACNGFGTAATYCNCSGIFPTAF